MSHVTRVSVGFNLPDQDDHSNGGDVQEKQLLPKDESGVDNEGANDGRAKWSAVAEISGLPTPSPQDPPTSGVELAELVVNPGLKKWESTEILNISIYQAARDGDSVQMNKIVTNLGRKKINKHDENGLSALHYAARYDNYNTARVLLEKGADANNLGEDDATPLHFAARYKRVRMKKSQSDNRLDDKAGSGDALLPSSDDADGASIAGDLEVPKIFSVLVDFGANINARDAYECTPLHFAAMRGNEQAAKELLSFRDIKIEDLLHVHSGQLTDHLHKIVKYASRHVYDCSLCRQKGFICEICDSPKVIYPFEMDSTTQCSKCKSVFHKPCKKDSTSCPKCKRLQQRLAIAPEIVDYAFMPEG